MKYKIILLFFLLNIIVISQTNNPKREFRGAWVATVTNLDWPGSGSSVESQKASLINIFDQLKEVGINAIIFQVRPECDALYDSPYEPWSYWLTGQQGKAPEPYYDPLQFAVEEAHKRGMELHAWFNPYRAVRLVGNYALASNHVTVQHPDWAIQIGTFKFLNPGLPEVREFVSKVIADVVRRYDVDGVHFDDYFYPYPPNQISNQDLTTFQQYPNGISNISDWRRDNVNRLIAMVYDSINTIKPYVKFGMSPFGIWKSGTPTGITGLNAYSDIYCDAVAWLQAQDIDYVTPQLYWPFGGGQDYGKLMPWWASQTNGRHLYVGHGYYRQSTWPSNEIPRQIRLNRNTANSDGSIFFRAANFSENPKGVTDSLRNNYFKTIALPPVMEWKDAVIPNAPENVRFAKAEGQGIAKIIWDIPQTAPDGDTASRYVIYRFNKDIVEESDLENSENIFEIVEDREFNPETIDPDLKYFVVTSLDRNWNESPMSALVEIQAPLVPELISPANLAINQRDTINLIWNFADNAGSYSIQISENESFTSGVKNYSGITDTLFNLVGLDGQQEYFWRVKSKNSIGESEYSSIFKFKTGFPVTPQLVSPLHATTNMPLTVELVWNKNEFADSYNLILGTSNPITSSTLVLDTTGLADTTFALNDLLVNKIYFWQIGAFNQFGNSPWSQVWGFRTQNITSVDDEQLLPKEYSLYQNYPNPFNPSTSITFAIPREGIVSLKVYNILGREIITLMNEFKHPGKYEVNFNAANLASGIYFYQLKVNDFVANKKMLYLK